MTTPVAIDAQAAFTGTVAPQGDDRLDEARLTRWFGDNVAGFTGPLSISKFKGGQSNPTYRIDAPSGPYVLRRKPFGKLLPSAHAVDREYTVQAALAGTGFPVAPQYGLCTDDSVIGSWFYVMGLAEGHTIWDGAMPGATPDERRAHYHAMVDTLAALHAIDVEAVNLGSYGKPGNYFGRQIDRWTRQYRLAETEPMPDMERLMAWLPQTLPEQTRTSVVHGDYRIDNLIFAHGAPRVAAVLDWELSTLGDPLADFTYLCTTWAQDNGGRSGVRDLDRKALGIPELDEVVARYCAATGRDGLPDIDWYLAYNLFRLASIVQGIKRRVIDGTASSVHAKDMAEKVPLLGRLAMEHAIRAGA
ncbi:phosphotransferase family protein [Novosphingobium sp.]|uniref:phosphotransferase family protein n=1 Tax=Novosphingobium sp. TaxID=1874826 RepID=UPI003D0B3669